MVKVLTGVQPGQRTDIEREVVAGAPTKDLQERVPQAAAPAGDFSDLLGPGGAAAAAPVADVAEGIGAGVEQEIAVQQERERAQIPQVGDRARDTETVHRYKPRGVDPNVQPREDGGIWARANRMASKYEEKAIGLGLRPSKAGFQAGVTPETVSDVEAEVNPGSLVAAANRSNAVQYPGGIASSPQVDPQYLRMGSIVTENMLAESALGDAELEAEAVPEAIAISKASNNAKLGQEIHAEYMRYKNAQEGKPTDQFQPLPREEANTLGGAFKELYFQANKGPQPEVEGQGEFITKAIDPKTGQAVYQFTRLGVANLKMGQTLRKRMFPKKNVRPSKTPLPGGLVGEARGKVKKVTGAVGVPAGMEVLEQATRNFAQIPNVVDKQRMKILFATALPVLAGAQVDQQLADMFGDINNMGPDKMASFAAAQEADKTGDYDAVANMQALQETIAQNIRAVAMEREGANYLTYQIQAYNGRIDPQQTFFDPTASKAVRFVTRNAVPAKATPGSRIEKNLRQMYALMLVPDADSKLPNRREVELDKWSARMEAWGDRLKTVLDNSIGDNLVEEVASAIERGIPLTDPNFPAVPVLGLDPQADADLIKRIRDKGEDGPHFIDGLIDFANYMKAKRAGRPHFSYFNGYIDGKTNGIASNGIQLGNEAIARQTGVIRDNKKELLDDGDIRHALKTELLHGLEHGPDGNMKDKFPEYYDVAKAIFSFRDLNKHTTMTFGYGKELESFGKAIDETMGLLEQYTNDPAKVEKHGLETYKESLASLLKDQDRTELVQTILGQYAVSLGNVMSDDALVSRSLMRSAAVMASVTNDLFSIKSYTGFDLNFGGNQALGYDGLQDGDVTNFTIYEDGKKVSHEAPRYRTHATAAAASGGVDPITGESLETPGQKAYGGSIPGPVQSLDAATVAMTVTGRSWNKLKDASNGNPYIHSVYDAFKMDAMGYDVVLEEVNRNWLKASGEWSYLEQTKISYNETMKNFWDQMNARPDDEMVSIAKGGEFQGIGALLSGKKPDGSFKEWPSALHGRLFKLMTKGDMTPEEFAEHVFNTVKRIKVQMDKADFPGWGESLPSEISVEHAKLFVAALNHALDLNNRLTSHINKTNKQKQDLLSKIRREGHEVYQYYAH